MALLDLLSFMGVVIYIRAFKSENEGDSRVGGGASHYCRLTGEKRKDVNEG